ncbi:MAG: FAD-binding oxidoreductase [Bacteroidales bacterium]
MVPAGGLSSVTGAVRAPQGGIALDLTRYLNRVIEINRVNKTVTVQAGMYGPALEAELNRQGYSCGHFPQSFEYSTVGGWISARGAGQASTGYGKIEDMVVALKAVTPAGIIETREYPHCPGVDFQGFCRCGGNPRGDYRSNPAYFQLRSAEHCLGVIHIQVVRGCSGNNAGGDHAG